MCKMKLVLFSVFCFQKGISIFGSLCSRLDLFQFFLKQCAIVIVTESVCHTFIIIVLKCLPIVNFVQQRQEHMMMGNPGGGAVQMYAGNAYTMNAVSDACDLEQMFCFRSKLTSYRCNICRGNICRGSTQFHSLCNSAFFVHTNLFR